ncbi:MAG: tetratricopeptide repeat protein [Kiritimatiellaeota bacterium]|nr:tetratricopeptide repeat protein [Kiritimatiellota bacterium]
MIETKTIKDITPGLRSNYQTAMEAANKNNTDYAILLLKGIVQKEPGFIDARTKLRSVEKIKFENTGFFGKLISGMKASGIAAKGQAFLKMGKHVEAMKRAEDALALNVAVLQALNLLAQAGIELKTDFITIEALEIAAEFHPKNGNVLDWLPRAHGEAGMGKKSLQIRQQIAAMYPKDMDKQQAVRAAAALATIEDGKYDKKDGDFRDSLKDKTEAEKMEQDERIVRDVDDVKTIIDDLEKAIAGGEGTVENHRKLADYYQRGGDHDRAIEHYQHVAEKMETLDPHIDKAIEKSEVAKYKEAIEQWEAYGAQDDTKKAEANQNIEQITSQMHNYQLERAIERVKLYPNDTELRFNLAVSHWNIRQVDEALQQFQFAQKNPHRRLISLVYLGRCFAEKGQLDIAIEQFEEAVKGMLTMNKDKMEALYHMALTYEKMDDKENAAACFKQIYQANVAYRDVAQRMEALYK